MAENHNLAAQVLKGRGANGTPIVMALRNVADAEFWDFRATDGSDAAPTSGFRRVGTPAELVSAIEQADVDTVIEITASMTVTHFGIPPLKDGLTIRGDRRGTRVGPELRVHEICERCGGIFTVGDDPPTELPVRITGLRIAGPSRGRYAKVLDQQGITTNSLRPVIIDRNDMSDWPRAAIGVDRASGTSDTCALPVAPGTWNNVRVLRNFIHHNEADNFGYGVAVDGTATVLGNTFLQNRHAITSNGNPSSGYAAYANLIQSNVPDWYDNGLASHGPQQDFDMHGFGPGADSHRNGGYAGNHVDIAWNTFFGSNRPNFELRGTPCTTTEQPDYFRNNVTTQDKGSTVKLRNGAVAYGYNAEGTMRVQSFAFWPTSAPVLLQIVDNKYGDSGSYAAPQSRDLRVADFDATSSTISSWPPRPRSTTRRAVLRSGGCWPAAEPTGCRTWCSETSTPTGVPTWSARAPIT